MQFELQFVSACVQRGGDEISTDAVMACVWYLIYISSGHQVIQLSAFHILRQQSDNVMAGERCVEELMCVWKCLEKAVLPCWKNDDDNKGKW